MTITPLAIAGVFEITLAPRGDERGYFMRTYDSEIFREAGMQTEWMQENQSLSAVKGTVRGLHYQLGIHAETKCLRAIQGSVLDVAVDVREGSPTFGAYVAVELSASNQKCLYIPKGCAHGFCTLEDNSTVAYKVDNTYAPDAEGGVKWSDPALGIPWPDFAGVIVSEKDGILPALADAKKVQL